MWFLIANRLIDSLYVIWYPFYFDTSGRYDFLCYFGIFCVQFHGVHVQCINIGGGKGEIPDNKHLQIALQHIHGIGRSRARQILSKLSIENKLARELTGRELYALREELNNYMCAHELVNFSYSLPLLLSLSPSRRLQVFGKCGYSHCSDKIKTYVQF